MIGISACLPEFFSYAGKKNRCVIYFFINERCLICKYVMIQKSELFLKSPLPFFKKKVFFIFNIYIVYLFINDLCHINYNRAVFRLQCFGYFGVLVELFAVIHGDGVHPVFMCL